MSYNGIGLVTPRGSGTNGYVQKNLSFVRPKQIQQQGDLKPPTERKPNKEILEHEKKRQIELRIVNFEEKLKLKGYSADEIAREVIAYRRTVDSKIQENTKKSMSETHHISAAKAEQTKRLKAAFGIKEGYEEGQGYKQLEDKMNGKPKEPEVEQKKEESESSGDEKDADGDKKKTKKKKKGPRKPGPFLDRADDERGSTPEPRRSGYHGPDDNIRGRGAAEQRELREKGSYRPPRRSWSRDRQERRRDERRGGRDRERDRSREREGRRRSRERDSRRRKRSRDHHEGHRRSADRDDRYVPTSGDQPDEDGQPKAVPSKKDNDKDKDKDKDTEKDKDKDKETEKANDNDSSQKPSEHNTTRHSSSPPPPSSSSTSHKKKNSLSRSPTPEGRKSKHNGKDKEQSRSRSRSRSRSHRKKKASKSRSRSRSKGKKKASKSRSKSNSKSRRKSVSND